MVLVYPTDRYLLGLSRKRPLLAYLNEFTSFHNEADGRCVRNVGCRRNDAAWCSRNEDAGQLAGMPMSTIVESTSLTNFVGFNV